jgi:glycosyltransferase involved in cell wall biosynthesis
MISVVIPCYNLARFLSGAFLSAAAQNLHRDIEIIVIDDGSTDDTAGVAGRLISMRWGFSARLIRQPNGGVAAARNAGIAEAKSDLICCLDADDQMDESYLAACGAALEAHPEASIAYGTCWHFAQGDGRHDPPPYDFARLCRSNFIGSAAVFRRQAWEDSGGYRDGWYEDWDFWIGCGAAGHFGVPAPSALWYYRVRDGSRYRQAVGQDAAAKAGIVLAHRAVYTPAQVAWAQAVQNGDPRALAAAGPVGQVPDGVGWEAARAIG